MSQTAQEIVNNANQTESPSQRIWEVDFLRGFLILFVVFDHFMFNLWYFCQDSSTALFSWLYSVSLAYYDSATSLGMLQQTLHNGFVMAFVFISGVSSNFTSNHFRRVFKLFAVALLLSAVTSALSQVIYRPLEINFNVIHVLTVCCFLYSLVLKAEENLSSKQTKVLAICLILLAVVLCVVGYYFRSYPLEDGGLLVVLVTCGNATTFSPADYLPLLPALSFFIFGAYLGRLIYKNKASLIGNKPKIATPLCWCGQKSLIVYVVSQAVMFVFFYIFAHLWAIL